MIAVVVWSGRIKTFTLDRAWRVLSPADTGGPAFTNHYTDGDDSPAFVESSDASWTRYVAGPGGETTDTRPLATPTPIGEDTDD